MNRKKIIRIILAALAVAALLAAGGYALWKNGFFEKINSVEALREVLPLGDLVLVMSVEPGFGGQSFIPGSLEKIAQLRAMAREMGLETIIEVDGGISARNAGAVYGAGADVLVAGSSVFGAEDPQAEVVKMLNA